MNDTIEIKTLLEKYYEGQSTDADEQRLHEYFASGNVDAGLQPYRSIFAYLQHEKDHPARPEQSLTPVRKIRPVKWWFAAASVAVVVLSAIFFTRQFRQPPATTCTGTYVMINGICYDDLSLVRGYTLETLEQVSAFNNEFPDVLDFLDEYSFEEQIFNK